MKNLLRTTLVIAVLAAVAHASQLNPIPLADLPRRADLQVLGKVTQVRPNGDQDEVTVEVASVLQGKAKVGPLLLTLTPRGVKGFDPELKPGDTGVFWVRRGEGKNYPAFPGAVALFPKPGHFTMPQTPAPQSQ